MSAGVLITAVLGGLALGAGLAATGPTARIDVTRGPAYQAAVVVDGEPGMSGTYTFAMTKVGRSGRSESQQGGPFEMTSATDTLSVSRVGMSPGDTVEMSLTVEWADGSTTTDGFSETVE
ncbi:curli-like amyloid fiber formation chaperone CsgH [Rubrivirga sp. IMCC43871]|uniref:curli-like amyloid fiber formation chaperone CsgH n=1 Tax=Rubrivirga sp. IMCC43871 TaxID=3391575 RepID=UPI00399034D6